MNTHMYENSTVSHLCRSLFVDLDPKNDWVLLIGCWFFRSGGDK